MLIIRDDEVRAGQLETSILLNLVRARNVLLYIQARHEAITNEDFKSLKAQVTPITYGATLSHYLVEIITESDELEDKLMYFKKAYPDHYHPELSHIWNACNVES